jgi:hypothetical protein
MSNTRKNKLLGTKKEEITTLTSNLPMEDDDARRK